MTSFAHLYNEYTTVLFKKYRSAFGFFDLGMVYDENRWGILCSSEVIQL